MTEHPKPLDDGALNNAIAAICAMPVPESPGATALLAVLSSQSTQRDRQVPLPASRFCRSFLMRRVVPLATMAAVMLLAVSSFTFNSTASTALAQVIEAASKHKLVRCQFQTEAEIKSKLTADGEEEFVEATSEEVVYFDLTSPRIRVERHEKTINDTVQSDWVTVQDNREARLLVTSSIQAIEDDDDTKALVGEHLGKTARLFRLSGEERLVPFTQVKVDKPLLQILNEMQGSKEVVATKEQLDGRDVTKYRLNGKRATTILWVDVEEKLPVRIEQELHEPKPNVRRIKWVYTNFAWDADAEKLDELFSTKPPADYKFEDHTKEM